MTDYFPAYSPEYKTWIVSAGTTVIWKCREQYKVFDEAIIRHVTDKLSVGADINHLKQYIEAI